jgi:aminobenzoyl-glutamate utilization protein B
VGKVNFTEEEQEFARKMQAYLGIEEKGYDNEIKPLPEKIEPVSGGSTDVAEVSWVTPTAGFSITTAASGIPWHSWAASACHGTTGGYRAAIAAAKVIALTGYDLLSNKDLLATARKEFDEAVKDKPYKSPLPPGQEPILP